MSDPYGNSAGFGQPPGGFAPPPGSPPPGGGGFAPPAGSPPPGSGGGPPQSTGPKVDPVAIAALVCGVVAMLSTCCCGLTVPMLGVPLVALLALAGIILGIIGLKRTNPQTGTHSGRGLAIGGLIVSAIGMVVVVLMLLLVVFAVGMDASGHDPDDIGDIIEDIFD